MTKEEWYEDVDYLLIRSHKIAVKKHLSKDKPWIVLLHGFPTCSYDWYKKWPTLILHYQVIALDFLGFGKSDKPYPYRYSIINQAEITLALLNQQQIEACYLLSHDYGVSVAQEILSRIQENRCTLHVYKIIFLNGGLFSEMHRPKNIQKLLLSPVGSIVGAMLSKKTLKKNFHDIFGPNTPPTEQEIDDMWELIQYNKGKKVFHLLIKYMLDRKENRDRWVKHMQETNIPMLLINGPEDPISGHHLYEYYHEIIPNAQGISLTGIGHYPNIEAPEKVSQATLDFFQ